MRRRAATAAAVLQLVLLAGIGAVLIVAGVVQATTPAPAAHIMPMRPATAAERQQWEVDQLADLLDAQAAAQQSGGPSQMPGNMITPCAAIRADLPHCAHTE